MKDSIKTGACCCGPQEFLRKCFRKKNLQQERSMKTSLNRCLGAHHLIFYGIAHMAGAGIYVLTGTMVKDLAGPAASLSYLLCAITAIFTGLCYVEFATFIPKAGSCYVYTYILLGELPAFIIGWTMISDVLVSIASVAKSFSGTIDVIFNNYITNITIQNVGSLPKSDVLAPTIDWLAVLLLLLLTLLTVTGAEISLTCNIVGSSIQIIILTLIAITCFVYGDLKNWTGSAGGFFPFGFIGVMKASSEAVFAFSGFECIANAAEETKNPKRDIPIALYTSLSVIAVLYLSSSLGISYLVPFNDININSPVVSAFIEKNQEWMKWLTVAGTLLATSMSATASVYLAPRIFYSLAKDGLIFKFMGNVNEKTQVPLISLLIGSTIACVLALFFNLKTLAEFVSLGILFSYFIVGFDLIVLRYLYQEEYSIGQKMILRAWAEPICRRLPWNCDRKFFLYSFGLFVFGCVALAITVNYLLGQNHWYRWLLLSLEIVFLIFTFAGMAIFSPTYLQDSYETPLLPLAPAVTMLINIVLIIRMSHVMWIRFAIWTFIGLFIYFIYGLCHSTAGYQDNNDNYSLKLLPNEKNSADLEEEEEEEEEKELNIDSKINEIPVKNYHSMIKSDSKN